MRNRMEQHREARNDVTVTVNGHRRIHNVVGFFVKLMPRCFAGRGRPLDVKVVSQLVLVRPPRTNHYRLHSVRFAVESRW